MYKNQKRPRDANKLAKFIVDVATREKPEEKPAVYKNPAAVELGRLGGLKGGKARAQALSSEQRKDIAQKAALARWSKKNDG